MIAFILAAALAAPQAPEAEARVVEYLKANVKPGQPVVVSELYNAVFTAPEERAVLNRLFNTFFKMPLYMAQHQKAAGRPPTSPRSRSSSDSRSRAKPTSCCESWSPTPACRSSSPATPRRARSRASTWRRSWPTRGSERPSSARSRAGRASPRPPSTRPPTTASPSSESLAGTPHLVYFWFTGCPPCVRTSPLLAELDRDFAARASGSWP